jgi:predicted ATPase/signal transduction histidine kinase
LDRRQPTFAVSSLDTAAALQYELVEELTSDERYRLARGRLAGAPRAVLIKVPALAPAPPEDVAGLKREYEILARPPIDAVTRALDLICDDRHCALVLEDHDARPLASLIAARSVSIGWVLDYGLQIAAALAGLHRAGIVHRGLSPRSVLVHGKTGRIRLTDFADAARDAAEACVPLARRQYRTRLPYAAPEQTGRVNRACDYRTDFYALGALLYEVLAGRPPFVADDPFELMHAHIARRPVPPADLAAAIPVPLSQIVMRLLAKQPEERYQSAPGLVHDLERCRREWAERGRIAEFPIASRDVSERFRIPPRLYGRAAEHAALLDAFEQACRGQPTLLLVEGPAGIGKTALIREMQEPVSRCRGHFVSGKFDQLSREVPYGALTQALRQRVLQILAEPPARMGRDRERIAARLGPNAAVIAELIPELEFVLGEQPPAPWLPPAEAHNRFTLAFQNFVAALATPESPLVVFLDDLQWADAATLRLCSALPGSPHVRHLLLIGAVRSAQRGADGALPAPIAALHAEGVAMQHIVLAPLALDALTQLAADCLRVDPAAAEPLARVLQDKTFGNPFFVTQFLVTLHQDGAITFDRERLAWSFDLDAIARAATTDNVVDLMSRKVERLPAATQRALTLAACVGNRFDARTLAVVCERPLRETLADLEEAVGEGLLVPEPDDVFAFLHDRVQQAAYARIDAADTPRVHLQVGRLLWAEHAQDGGDIAGFDRLFDTVSHLNLGAHLIESAGERLSLARLNLAAGNRAKSSAAHRTALGYFTAGLDLLDASRWQTDYELVFELHLEAAQCEYLCGNFDAASRRFAALFGQARTDFDRARVDSQRAIQYEMMSRYDAALASAIDALRGLGVALPDSMPEREAALQAAIATIDARVGTRAIASLIDLPVMVDPAQRMVMRILINAWASAYILGETTLARLISATLVRLSLEHGNAEESAYGFVTHAITAGPVRGDYDAAWEWGNLALRVNERFDDRRLRAKICQQFHAHVCLWRRPLAACVDYAREACRSGLENGDFLYAAYGASTEAWPALAASQDLGRFIADVEPNLTVLAQLKNTSFADALRLMINWARALQGRTAGALSLSDPVFDEQKYVETYRDNPFFSMFHAIARLHLCFLLDDAAGAAQAADAVRVTAHQLTGMLWSVQFEFWNGMRLAAQQGTADMPQRAVARTELEAAQQSLAALAASCPENFRCHALLLGAELARISDRPLEALDLFEQAVNYADQTGTVQHQALANERCGRFWHGRGNRRLAASYLRSAVEWYARWGAHAKVRSLAGQFPQLLGAPAGTVAPAAAEGAHHPGLEPIDLVTLGKVAHAISADVELGAPLRQMLSVAIENAGASRGVLIEVREGEPWVVAEGTAGAGETVLLPGAPLGAQPARCSSAVVNYVYRTGATLVVADAAFDGRFAMDEYLAATQPRSILCLAGQHQGEPRAILYLENQFAGETFSADRIDVIRILAAQAAISLESAQLLQRIQRETGNRQRAEQTLHAIEEGLAAVTGSGFFRALVRNVARALQVRYAFVADCVPAADGHGKIARARAFWSGDDFGANFEYAVASTPCEQVLDGEVCHHGCDLQAKFPADAGLVHWGAHSYLGLPLVGAGGDVIGHLAILDSRPMPDATMALAVLRLSAGRAGAELERLRADEDRQRALDELERLKNRLQEENVYLRRELIANVSHDLRSPLASLRGYLDTLLIKEDSLGAAERRAYLAIALRQAEHLQMLISELFDLARLDFDGYRIAPEPLHLGELARDVVQKFQLKAEQKQVRLQLGVDDSTAFVRADIGLIERVLENLIENAFAHTPPGGQVRLAVAATDDGVLIEVADTGDGIPAADLPHVFERFYRVDKARTRERSGCGLGLAIVKRIVELHDSEIRVESEVGAGTRFWFTLKTAPHAEPASPH